MLYALAAGLMWGLVFVAPLLLPEYPPGLLAVGRYLAFGVIVLPMVWMDRVRLAKLSRADWVEAFKLALIGNLLYYLTLAAAIQRVGAPLPTMIIGTLPVVIAVSANLLSGQGERLPWGRLAPPLLLIAAGIACVNHDELSYLQKHAPSGASHRGWGVALALVALVCWTIYPIRNARWLREHAGRSPSTWATAQGVATLPLALLGFVGLWVWWWLQGNPLASVPLGPRPGVFVGLMLAMGLFASWLGTLCWNEASQRLPTAVGGALIVFETLAALAYALLLRGEAPSPYTLAGAALLIAGVLAALLWALRKPAPALH